MLFDTITLVWIWNGPVTVGGTFDLSTLEVEDPANPGTFIAQLFDSQNTASSFQTADGTVYDATSRYRCSSQPTGISQPIGLPIAGTVS